MSSTGKIMDASVSVCNLCSERVQSLFSVADKMKSFVLGTAESTEITKLQDQCKGKVMACVFYEPSTRTNCSFTAAMERLGGSVLQGTNSSSNLFVRQRY